MSLIDPAALGDAHDLGPQLPAVELTGRSRLHQELMHHMMGAIIRGRYPAGQRLPPELELACDLAVSRGVVRDLLRSLADRRVVSIRRGRGTWVNQIGSWNVLDADVLTALMPTTASVGILTHYLECRRILETEAAALAADRASSRDLAAMADALTTMSDLALASQADREANRRFHEADIAFHGVMFRASGNQVLPLIVEPIQRAMATLLPLLALHPEERLRKAVPEHKAILAAIADHDADGARDAMTAHLATVQNYLREYRTRTMAPR
jgi:GntR family transcriptional repressor for pyruvate dehydrogenase complex